MAHLSQLAAQAGGAPRTREAIAELTRESGRRFDPDVVAALTAMLEES